MADVSEKGIVKNRQLNAISWVSFLYGWFESTKLSKFSQNRNNEALIHLIKMNVGIGVMAMPNAFYNAGMVVGIITMTFMASITVHCMHLLVNAGQVLTQKTGSEFLDYAEVVEAAMKNSSKLSRFQNFAK